MRSSKLSDRVRRLQWALPLGIGITAVIYQLGPAYYVHEHYGHLTHWIIEIFFYGLVGPFVLWYSFRSVRQWVAEKEIAEAEVYRLNEDLQQRVEERTRELSEKNEALAKANAELQQIDRIKSEFVSLVSHELRAPLTNMRSALELIEESDNHMDPNCSFTLSIVRDQVGRLTRLVEEVLNVSRIEAGSLTVSRARVDVLQVADHVLDEFAARHTGHRLRRPRGGQHPRVWADPDFLYQVMSNLVDNAVKYAPAGSEVNLSIEISDHESVVAVSDHGPGIPVGEQHHIFEKFHRLDAGDSKETYGYGLGLYICRRLVEAMSGRIWVESEPAQGATFKVALPLAS